MKKAIHILQNLNPREKFFSEKAKLLATLILYPNHGIVMEKKLVSWARRVKLNPICHCEDRTSWWTVNVN